jgi:hypothetical protein
MDNASNNDTMMTSLEARCQMEGIELSAGESRMCCMPHTIHLAALKVSSYFLRFTPSAESHQLLEAIGVISKKDGDKAAACGSNYQDDVTLRTEEDDETCQDNEDCEENILEAVSKVAFVR